MTETKDPNNANETLADEVQKSFLSQFAQNQNHQQLLFIQFLSSLIIVLAAFAYVYTNTSSIPSRQIQTRNTTQDSSFLSIKNIADTTPYLAEDFDADLFKAKKTTDGKIISYGVIHLICIYLFTSIVLIILSIVLLHMGYSFRRDQAIVNRVRKNALGKDSYEKIFGNYYSGENKNIFNYLPNFYSILFLGMFFIVCVLYLLIYQYFSLASDKETFIEGLLSYTITYEQTRITLSFPICLLVVFYGLYFYKYNKKVNYRDYITNLSLLKITKRSFLFRLGLISSILLIVSLCFYFFCNSLSFLAMAYIMGTNVIICFITFFLVINKNETQSGQDSISNKAIMISSLIHGLIFLAASFHLGYFSINNLLYKETTIKYVSLQLKVNGSLFFFFFATYLVIEKYKRNIQFRVVLLRLLRNAISIFFLSCVSLLFMSGSNMKWPDTAFAIIMSIVIFFWSLSRFSKFFDLYFKKS